MKSRFLIIFLISLFGCQKEQLPTTSTSEDKEFQVQISTFSQDSLPSYKPEVFETIKELEKEFSSKQSLKNSDTKSFNIGKKVIHIEHGENYESFTFQLYRSNKEMGVLENLLLSQQKDRSYKPYIIRYNLSAEEVDLLRKGNFVSVKDKMEIFDFNGDLEVVYKSFQKSYIRQNSDGSCDEIRETEGPLGYPVTQIIAGVPCDATGGGSSDGGSDSSSGGSGEYDPGEPGEGWPDYDGSGGSSGGGTTTPSNPDPNTDPSVEDCIADSNGNCIGDITTPNISTTANQVIDLMGLHVKSRHYSWLVNDATDIKTYSIYNFLIENGSTSEAIAEAEMLIDLQIAKQKGWDLTQTGTYLNRSNLKYKGKFQLSSVEAMYLLENGLVLYVANGPKQINSEPVFASSENHPDGYHYIYSYDTGRYYEYRLPLPGYPNTDLDFLFSGFWDGVKLFGRYATPLEDVIILIDGKDFDGVSESRAVAGVLVLMDAVPGGKIVRITKKSGLALKATSKVSEIALTSLYKSQKKQVDSYLDAIAYANDTRKGNWSEMAVDVEWFEKGYKDLHVNKINHIDARGHKGIDHIFQNPETGEFIIVETKYYGSGGLTPEDLATGRARQMSDEWISDGTKSSSDRLWNALNGNLDLYNQIKPNPNTLNYQRVIAYVKADGTINYKYIGSNGYELSTIFYN